MSVMHSYHLELAVSSVREGFKDLKHPQSTLAGIGNPGQYKDVISRTTSKIFPNFEFEEEFQQRLSEGDIFPEGSNIISLMRQASRKGILDRVFEDLEPRYAVVTLFTPTGFAGTFNGTHTGTDAELAKIHLFDGYDIKKSLGLSPSLSYGREASFEYSPLCKGDIRTVIRNVVERSLNPPSFSFSRHSPFPDGFPSGRGL